MLYKKYHRNYIRQFKEGTKVIYKTCGVTIKDTVRLEPYYTDYYDDIVGDRGIYLTGYKYAWALIYYNGKLDYKTEIVENAVQEIS